MMTEPLSVSWTKNPDTVDGYRIYKGDSVSRVFVTNTKETSAVLDVADGESFFVTAYQGVLESRPSDGMTFEFQESNNLVKWNRVERAQLTGSHYFTRFEFETMQQPIHASTENSVDLPDRPDGFGVASNRQLPEGADRNSWLRQYVSGPPLIRTAAEGAPASEISFVGQRCRVGDEEPFEWYWASSLTRWEKEPRALGIRDLPTPWIIAHRGGWNVAPEHSLEAYRMSFASGIHFIEPDVQVLPDGTVVVMHDQNIARTTNGSGFTANQTASSWGTLLIDDGARLKGWSTNLKCPTFDDVLREFGNRVVLVPEAKNEGAGAAIVRKLQEFNIRKDMVIIQGSATELAPGVAAGYPCMRMSSTNYAGTIAAGIEFTGFGWNETAKITAATEAGLKVIVWTTQRNVDLTSALDAGAIAAFSDDPVYQAGLHRTRKDRYDSKAYYHGDLRGTGVALDTPNSAMAVSTKTSGAMSTFLLGWASPVENPENFVLDSR